MQTRRALAVDAFTDEPLAGNAAGVVPDADGLSDAQLQAIARELNASETAFLVPSGAADRRVRFFTPTTEIDLCGHATIASHAYLAETGVIDVGSHSLETNVGVLDIETEPDGTVWMTQNQPEVREAAVDVDAVAAALQIDPDALDVDGLPVARASTGLPFLVVPVRLLEDLGGVDPDLAAIERLSDATGTAGVYAFTFDTLDADATLHGRAFLPAAGIAEDPVTGTASGAVGAYLRHFGAFDPVPDEMVFEQGAFVDRPGRVGVRVGETVQVGGRAATALDGELRVPDIGDDEIIEV